MGHIFSNNKVKETVFPFIRFDATTYHGSEWYQVERIKQEDFEKYFKPGTLVKLNLEESEGDYGYCYSSDEFNRQVSLFMFGTDRDTIKVIKKILVYKECYNNLKAEMISISMDKTIPFKISMKISDTIEMLNNRIKNEAKLP